MRYSKASRRLDVSAMLVEMGNALMKEGTTNKDYSIMQTGTFLVLIGSLLLNEDDTRLFGQICGMFSAKKVLEKMDNDKLSKNFNGESYDDFIKRINKLRGKGDDEDLLK